MTIGFVSCLSAFQLLASALFRNTFVLKWVTALLSRGVMEDCACANQG